MTTIAKCGFADMSSADLDDGPKLMKRSFSANFPNCIRTGIIRLLGNPSATRCKFHISHTTAGNVRFTTTCLKKRISLILWYNGITRIFFLLGPGKRVDEPYRPNGNPVGHYIAASNLWSPLKVLGRKMRGKTTQSVAIDLAQRGGSAISTGCEWAFCNH